MEGVQSKLLPIEPEFFDDFVDRLSLFFIGVRSILIL